MPLFLNILSAQTQHDPVLRARALAGLRRYQEAARPARPPGASVVAQTGSARLLHFGGDKARDAATVILIPSLINPPEVLDLSERSSLARWLSAQGHDVMLVDWGAPDVADRDLSLADHVTRRLMHLLDSLDPARPPILVGYCLGGTLAAALATQRPTSGLVTIAAPWHFDGFSDAARQDIAHLWDQAKPLCEKLGYVPMEVMQSGFWALDPARTIAKYADFGEMQDGSDSMAAFMALEDWANAGPPLPYAAGRDLFERLYANNATGTDSWMIDGKPVCLSDLAVPTLSIASSTDRIVPAASAPRLANQWTLDMGHVGMIVGSKAPARLWHPLSEWLFKYRAGC